MSNINELYPARKFANVTTSDSTDLISRSRGILLGVAGDIAIHDENGNTVVISALAAGVIHPISTKRILATSTTATDICIFY